VLAHEIAHVTQYHIARKIERQKQKAIPNLAAILGALILASHDSNAGTAALMTLSAGRVQGALNFSRKSEREADRIGLDLMLQSEFNPYGMAKFFDRLNRESRYNEYQIPPFLSTHPISHERMNEMMSRLKDVKVPLEKTNIQYALVKTRLNILLLKSANTSIQTYQALTEKRSAGLAERYGYVLALQKGNRPVQALKKLAAFSKQEKNLLPIRLLQAELWHQTGKGTRALKKLKNMHQLNPNNHAVNMTYAHILTERKQYREAQTLLEAEHKRLPLNQRVFQQLYVTQGKAGRMVEALITHARYEMSLGDPSEAKTLLEQALKQSKDTQYYQHKIKALLQELKESMNEGE